MNAKQIIIAMAALVASVAVELLLPGAQHGQGWWTRMPGFFSMFGFFVCLLLIVFAKGLGSYWLQRPDDYYDHDGRDE
ncbi:MAG: hypothetical protein WD688_15265 [Candidatus Binatia bacterium]